MVLFDFSIEINEATDKKYHKVICNNNDRYYIYLFDKNMFKHSETDLSIKETLKTICRAKILVEEFKKNKELNN
jgi:hypothetical protein